MKDLTKALLIEPDVIFRKALQKVLEREGLEVLVASSLVEALSVINETPVSLITTELMLDDSTGIEVLDRLRHSSNDSMIIALTAFTELIPETEMQHHENIIFMRKPVGLREFLEKISGCINGKVNGVKDKMSEESIP
jgi:DNA-binding response OmpR family regulator